MLFGIAAPDHYRQPGSNIEYWVAKVERNVRRDDEVDAILRDAGWTVVRIWEHENPVTAADRVERLLRAAKSPGYRIA
ncbi:DNA mismatch endonuclease vsr [Mycobacterium bohemicum DSM 44277]|uniref:DNA mismatch endonuclease vsr n=1 Tax=Mycobacterium bohemicum DSM 44277 TaxID=1236609 RepID=A0A0U0WC93_MYCBE|nr:DNA mismatch endonuclease vsr [Mycobacterium bohemicum DSM 44277]